MPTIIKPQAIEDLKEIFSKITLSRTDLVTKITDGSVFNGLAFGTSKLAQKNIKDVALAQSHFYPDAAYGTYLDNIASFYGIASRFGASGSSTYIRLVGEVGTVYASGTTVNGNSGQSFTTDEALTLGDAGYGYVKVSSQNLGLGSNVDSFDLNDISPVPDGHLYVTNEFAAFGGRDTEDDDEFRERIKNAINELSRGTIEMLNQVFNKINPIVLRTFNLGVNTNGQVRLGIVTQNGTSLTQNELDNLLTQARPYFTLTELNPNGLTSVGVELVNMEFETVDISMRVRVNANYNPVGVRKDMQARMNRYLDYRFWNMGDRVEWDDLLQIAKSTEGIDYVIDTFFFPRNDIQILRPNLPRIRGFLMLDEEGEIISDGTATLNPVFYPDNPDFSFHSTVLANL